MRSAELEFEAFRHEARVNEAMLHQKLCAVVHESETFRLEAEANEAMLQEESRACQQLALLGGDATAARHLDVSNVEQFLASAPVARERVRLLLKRKREEEGFCKVCLENDADTVLPLCGHMALCSACAQRAELCPLCHRAVQGFITVLR